MRLITAFGLTLLVVGLIDIGKGKKPPDNGNNGKPPDNNQPPANKNPLGDNIQQKPMDNSGYDSKGGQAGSPNDLKCDFEGPCCWKNTKPPYDTMEYTVASGTINPDILQKFFGTSSGPRGNFAATGNAAVPADKAELESCVIPCAGDGIKVTLKHWQSSGTKVQVCEVAKSDPNTLLSCQDLPSSSPGPDTVTLPRGSDLILSIVATNFVFSDGGAVLINDISVDYPPCSSSGPPAESTPAGTTVAGATTVPPTEGPSAAPTGLCCDFASGPCAWTKGGGPESAKGETKDFESAGPGYYHNRATGVVPSPDRKCQAAYLKPTENAYMESSADFGDAYIIKFQEYKATEGLSLKACCDTDAGCTYDTGGKVEKGDFHQWYQGSIECPAGTKKVVFYAENAGNHEGGVGIDNIEVLDKAGNILCR